jgi:hypothetical protein
MNSHDSFRDAIRRCADELTDPHAPPLGVHVMSEFMYCPRAGIIAIDQQQEDNGCEAGIAPSLGGLPTHELHLIEQALQQYRQQLAYSICLNVAVLLFALLALLSSWGVIALLMLAGMYLPAKSLLGLLRDYDMLRQRLRDAQTAAIQEPDWSLRIPQPIQWWRLIRAGFDSVEKQAALADHDLRLAGKPWRVLQRGERHVPVIAIRVDVAKDDRRREGQFSPQLRARLAAYAYLISRIEGAQADWAIVLFGNSTDGVAVPIEESMLSLLAEGLLAARRQVLDYRADPSISPAPARGMSPCVGCPHGKPIHPERKSVFRGVEVTQLITRSADGKRFHSTCGDRFRWVPPHEQAKRLGLESR